MKIKHQTSRQDSVAWPAAEVPVAFPQSLPLPRAAMCWKSPHPSSKITALIFKNHCGHF
jgi:hypothetical protein